MKCMREIRLLQEQELQSAVRIADEVFERCVQSCVTEQERSGYRSYVRMENLRQGVCSGQLSVWGAVEDGALAGVGALQSDGRITMLYVLPGFQRRGIGSGLLTAMCGYAARVLGLHALQAYVSPVTLAPFFYHRGFSLLPDGARGDGYVGLGCPLQTAGEGPGQFAEYRKRYAGISYPSKRVPAKAVLWLTAVVLGISFVLASGITIYYLAV